MKNLTIFFLFIILGCGGGGGSDSQPPLKHLYVLAGQSNMRVMPTEAFSKWMPQDTIIVKYTVDGTCIKEWNAGLYKGILTRLPKEYDDMTLVWMQGECDARNFNSDTYYDDFLKLVELIGADHVVIGRLCHFYIGFADGDNLRAVQETIGNELGCWVNTDDLECDGHFDDYETLGKRFADACKSLNRIC